MGLGRRTCSMAGMKCRVSESCPGDSVKVSGHPFRSQTMWILVVSPPRLRPRAWSTGSWYPPFYRLQRRREWRGSTSSRSSRCPGPSGHPLATEVEDAPRRPRRCRRHASGGSGRRPSSTGRSAQADRATWRPSRGSRRCRLTPGGHHGEGVLSAAVATRCPR